MQAPKKKVGVVSSKEEGQYVMHYGALVSACFLLTITEEAVAVSPRQPHLASSLLHVSVHFIL